MDRYRRSKSFQEKVSFRSDLGIVTAVKTEFNAVLDKMKQNGNIKRFFEDEGTKAEKIFCVGRLGGQDCVLSMAGVGTEDAKVCTERMINKYGAQRIINVGSAGTNAESKVNIGDCVISRECVRFDVDITVIDGYKKGSYEKYASPFIKANEELVDLAKKASDTLKIPYHVGTVMTGNIFINNPEQKRKTMDEFGALCDEMEGASVAKYCAAKGVPFVVIRCISDKPTKQEEVMYYNHYEDAANRCAKVAEKFSEVLKKERNKDLIHKLKRDVDFVISKKSGLEM
jgi:adenosylhomocysteine nucleosidase